MANQIPDEVRHAGSLFFKGRYEEAFEIITNYEKKGPHSPRDKLSALILKGWVSNNLLRFNESVKIGELAYILSKELGDNLSLFDALGFMSLVFLSGEFEKARKYALEAEEVLNNLLNNPNLDLTRQKADILYRKGWINFLTGDLDKALENAIPCLELVKKTKDKMYESTVSILLGYVYHMRGELDIGLDYATKSLNIQRELKNKNGIAECLGLLGFIYYNKGDLNRALEVCKEGLSFENLHNRTKVGVLRPLGHIYREKGELDKALECLKEATTLSEQDNNHLYTSYMYHEIGSIYRIKGDYDKALKNIENSLQIAERMNLIPQMVLSLVILVLIYLDKNEHEQANRYFIKLEDHIDKTDYKVITQGYLMTKALMIKSKGRFQNRVEAEKLLKEVVEDDIIDPVFQILSVVLLCDLLIEELSFSNDSEILEEIEPLIKRLLNIAKKQNSSLYLAETKLLQAKLSLLQVNIENAQYLMTQAQQIAELHDLNLLAIKISSEHDSLLQSLEEWRILKEKNAPLADRVNLASINGVINRLQGKKALEILQLSPETPVLILIFKGSETPLFSHSFSHDLSFEDDIISSFISAFNTFSRELFSKGLDRAKFGDYLILIESVDPFSVCYIFKGQTYPAKQKLTNFIEKIQNNSMIWATLEKFHKTSQVAQLKDLPQIDVLIKEIFST